MGLNPAVAQQGAWAVSTPRIETWDDIAYSAEFKFFNDDPKSCVVDFRVWEGDDRLDDDPPVCTGSVKWDGCANIDLCADGLAHFCSRADLHRFNVMTNRVYRTAGRMLSESPSGFLDDCK